MKEAEVKKLIIEWKDEIKVLVSNYEKAIGKLDTARKKYETSKREVFYRLIPFFIAIVQLIMILVVINCSDKISSIKAGNFEVNTKHEQEQLNSKGSLEERKAGTVH